MIHDKYTTYQQVRVPEIHLPIVVILNLKNHTITANTESLIKMIMKTTPKLISELMLITLFLFKKAIVNM